MFLKIKRLIAFCGELKNNMVALYRIESGHRAESENTRLGPGTWPKPIDASGISFSAFPKAATGPNPENIRNALEVSYAGD